MSDDLPDPMTAAEIAARERLPVKTVMRWCAAGQVPGAYKIGRWWRIPREAYLAMRRPVYPKEKLPRVLAPRIGGPSRQRLADEYLDRIGV